MNVYGSGGEYLASLECSCEGVSVREGKLMDKDKILLVGGQGGQVDVFMNNKRMITYV